MVVLVFVGAVMFPNNVPQPQLGWFAWLRHAEHGYADDS